jgi:ABC-type sugar transport system substrate-binding protein
MLRVVVPALALVAVAIAPGGNARPTASGANGPESLRGKTLCYVSPVNIDVMNEMFNNITKAAKITSTKVQVVNAKGDFALALSQTQQYLASGNCAAIGVVTSLTPTTAAAWESVAKQASDKGVFFANFSADWVTGAGLNVSNPHCPGGEVVAKLAAAWYMKHGNGGEVGVLTAPQNAGLTLRTNCFEKKFKQLVGKPVKVWEAADKVGGVQDSAAATGSLLQAHPGINVMFGWGADTSVGITRAVNEAGHKDPSKFFVGAMDLYAPSLADMATKKSVLQGGTVFDYDYAGTSWNWAIENALLGNKVPPTAVALPIQVTPSNAAFVATADKHVGSGVNQSFFAQAMVYCDKAVKYGDPFPAASACKSNPTYYKAP